LENIIEESLVTFSWQIMVDDDGHPKCPDLSIPLPRPRDKSGDTTCITTIGFDGFDPSTSYGVNCTIGRYLTLLCQVNLAWPLLLLVDIAIYRFILQWGSHECNMPGCKEGGLQALLRSNILPMLACWHIFKKWATLITQMIGWCFRQYAHARGNMPYAAEDPEPWEIYPAPGQGAWNIDFLQRWLSTMLFCWHAKLKGPSVRDYMLRLLAQSKHSTSKLPTATLQTVCDVFEKALPACFTLLSSMRNGDMDQHVIALSMFLLWSTNFKRCFTEQLGDYVLVTTLHLWWLVIVRDQHPEFWADLQSSPRLLYEKQCEQRLSLLPNGAKLLGQSEFISQLRRAGGFHSHMSTVRSNWRRGMVSIRKHGKIWHPGLKTTYWDKEKTNVRRRGNEVEYNICKRIMVNLARTLAMRDNEREWRIECKKETSGAVRRKAEQLSMHSVLGVTPRLSLFELHPATRKAMKVNLAHILTRWLAPPHASKRQHGYCVTKQTTEASFKARDPGEDTGVPHNESKYHHMVSLNPRRVRRRTMRCPGTVPDSDSSEEDPDYQPPSQSSGSEDGDNASDSSVTSDSDPAKSDAESLLESASDHEDDVMNEDSEPEDHEADA
jgi:hypothetical protein